LNTDITVISGFFLVVGIGLLVLSTAAEAGAIEISKRSIPSLSDVGLNGVLRYYVRERQRTLRALRAAVTAASILITISSTIIASSLVSNGDGISFLVMTSSFFISIWITSIIRSSTRIFAQSLQGFWNNYTIAVASTLQLAFRPVAWLLSATATIPLRAIGLSGSAEHLNPADELIQILEFSDDEDLNDQRKMIHSVLELQGQTARELMTPRTDVTAISTESSFDVALELALQSGFSRIPLYRDSLDEVIGTLYIKDLIRYIPRFQKPSLEDIAREPVFIPETMEADKVLSTLRTGDRSHLAIAVDEYGGTAGVITIEDVIEEITGEIVDEFDPSPEIPQFEQVAENSFSVDATATIDDLNDYLGTEVRVDDVDTVGGLVVSTQGRLGEVGDSIEVLWGDVGEEDAQAGSLLLTVNEIDGQRIKRVQIEHRRDVELSLEEAPLEGNSRD
jgi:putative hemolysin